MEFFVAAVFAGVAWVFYRSLAGSGNEPSAFDLAVAEAAKRRQRIGGGIEPVSAPAKQAATFGRAKSYPVGIVGERSYQAQIETLREGQPVKLWHEPGNPYDDRAVAVATFAGETIGYLARDFWLRDALLDEQKPCSARVMRLAKNGKMTGVVIEVTLSGTPIGERAFTRS